MKRKVEKYKLNLFEFDGVTCASIAGSGKHYSVHGDREPKGRKSVEYKDKPRKRGVILVKLGIWENGQNSVPEKKQP